MGDNARAFLMFGVVANIVLGVAMTMLYGAEKSAFNFGIALLILALNPELTRR